MTQRTDRATGVIHVDIPAYCKRTGRFLITSGPFAHRGKVNVLALHHATGLAYSTLWPLVRKPDQKAILSDTLARLCDALQCQPGDILKYEPFETPGFYKPAPPSRKSPT
jgi:DNA-binding Xre family transcriptional regulator